MIEKGHQITAHTFLSLAALSKEGWGTWVQSLETHTCCVLASLVCNQR